MLHVHALLVAVSLSNPITAKLIEWAIPLVIGYLTTPAVDIIKHGVGWLDKAPPIVKKALAIIIAGLGTALATIVGADIPTDPTQWDAVTVQALLAGLFAIMRKQGKQIERINTAADALPSIAAPYVPSGSIADANRP